MIERTRFLVVICFDFFETRWLIRVFIYFTVVTVSQRCQMSLFMNSAEVARRAATSDYFVHRFVYR